jgi:transcriptional regulator of acetoin/glycerol metabolism
MAYTPEAWRNFIQRLQDSTPLLERPYILESWQRCHKRGLAPAPDNPVLRRVDDAELRERLQANNGLVEAAAPILTGFSASLGALQYVIYATDRDGIVLWSGGNSSAMLTYGLTAGYDWSEATMGTNGAGTALATNGPVAVIGPDHYQLSFHGSTCLAAPIHSQDGALIGAIDFSTDVSDADPSQLAQVIRLAHQIERRLAGMIAVLVVDDNEAQRYMMERMLSKHGFTVLGAVTAHDALRKASILRPDVIVLDVSLPDENGFVVCNRLKSDQNTKGIPVVQVSALYTQKDAIKAGYSAGADAYLVHPAETQDLPKVVCRVLGMKPASAA